MEIPPTRELSAIYTKIIIKL